MSLGSEHKVIGGPFLGVYHGSGLPYVQGTCMNGHTQDIGRWASESTVLLCS